MDSRTTLGVLQVVADDMRRTRSSALANVVGLPTYRLIAEQGSFPLLDDDYATVTLIAKTELKRLARHANKGGDVSWPSDFDEQIEAISKTAPMIAGWYAQAMSDVALMGRSQKAKVARYPRQASEPGAVASNPGYEPVSFSVCNLEPVRTKTVFAFVDVEVVVAGVAFWVRGVTARHLAGGGTSIHLPTYRTPAGAWRAAVELPSEMIDALTQAVLDYLLDAGIAVRKAD
ncbi:MAG: uncharacterized protein JWO51_4992 [Rhodospirillales bacterium]|nr:uncharacterized protein [Rhodospirillales bacterium]